MKNRSPMSGPRCVCGKTIFTSRAQARAAARSAFTRGQRPYICEVSQTGYTVFHLGGLADSVKRGEATRDVIYQRGEGEVEARRLVGIRAKLACETCGGKGYEFSHRRTRGVRDEHQWCACNGTLSCHTCHEWLHAHPLDARVVGLMVSRFADEPAKVPVRLRTGWVLLHCDGTTTRLRPEQVVTEHGAPALAV